MTRPEFRDDRKTLTEEQIRLETSRCLNCGTEYNVIQQNGYCPECNSFEKEVISGRDFIIREIQVNLGG